MKIEEKESYHFSIWAKAEKETSIEVALLDDNNKQISNSITISIEGGNTWKKYTGAKLIAANSAMGQLGLHMQGQVSIDMVSLMHGVPKKNLLPTVPTPISNAMKTIVSAETW